MITHERSHTGQNSCKCNVCGKAYTTKYNLKIHILTVHLGVKYYKAQCEVCEKKSPSNSLKYNPTTHLRIHTEERPYHCGQCNKCFTFKSNLTAHLKSPP